MSRTTTHDRPIRRDVLAVAAVAVAVRLVWVIPTARTPRGLSDPILYFRSAVAMADGGGYQSFEGRATAYYPPGFPMFLAAQRWLLERVGLGDHLALVNGLVGALLGGAAAGALVVAGRRLGSAVLGARSATVPDGRGAAAVGIASGLVFACWPNVVFYSSAILSETLFLACFAVMLAAVLTMTDGRRLVPWRVVVAAASLGIATLVRPQVLLVIPALALSWILSRAGWRTVAVGTAALAAGVIVVVAPWTARNATVFNAFVPVSTNSGHNLCIGFHEEANGGFAFTAACETEEKYVDGPAAERRIDVTLQNRAVEWAKTHVAELPRLSLGKLWYTYNSDTDGLRGVESYDADRFLPDAVRGTLKVVANVAYAVLAVATIAGFVVCWVGGWRHRHDDPAGLELIAVAVASFVVPVLAFGDPRFKVAATPAYALLAGLAAAWLWGVLSSTRRPRPAVQEESGAASAQVTAPGS